MIWKSPILPPTSSIARRMPFTIVVVWALALPVRGRLDQILMTPAFPPLGGVLADPSVAGALSPPPSVFLPPQPTSASVVTAASAIIPDLLMIRPLARKREAI